MKKTIIALAVFATVAGAAVADSNVTFYGLVDMGVARESGGAAGSITKLSNGIANGSRFGFKGSEDLGNGLSAFFDIQNGFNADTGTLGQGGLLFGRQAFVGLKGAFGTIKMGRQYTVIDDLVGASDPFGNGYAGRLQNVFMKNYASRIDNNVMYGTPKFNGFDANIAYGAGEVAGDAASNRYLGTSAGYAAGPLFVRLAHQYRNHLVGTGSTNAFFGPMTSDRNTMLGATYDFGPVKLHGAYAVTKTDNGSTNLVKADDAMIGASKNFGPGMLMATYVRRDDKSSNNRDANQIALGYNYFMSKRTTLYAAYARIDNKYTDRLPMIYTVGNATELGSGDSAFNLGIRHTF